MLTKDNKKTLFQNKKLLQNESFDLHTECIIQINNFHDELLKEKTNYIILDNKYKGLQTKYEILEKENKDLNIKVNDLLLWKKYHKCNSMDMEDTKKMINEYMMDKKLDIEKIKEQNKKPLDSNNSINKVELNKKIEDISDNILQNVKDKQEINIEDPVFENIGNINEDISSKDKTLKKNIIKTPKINKSDEIVNANINKIINKLDKLYKKEFTDEQITINKSLINFYSKIYDLIKDKDEKNDAKYINDIIDSISTDTNRPRFKKIIKVANFINNHTYLDRSAIVIPLYMFKIIPNNSIDNLFSKIIEHFKDEIINDDNSSNNNI